MHTQRRDNHGARNKPGCVCVGALICYFTITKQNKKCANFKSHQIMYIYPREYFSTRFCLHINYHHNFSEIEGHSCLPLKAPPGDARRSFVACCFKRCVFARRQLPHACRQRKFRLHWTDHTTVLRGVFGQMEVLTQVSRPTTININKMVGTSVSRRSQDSRKSNKKQHIRTHKYEDQHACFVQTHYSRYCLYFLRAKQSRLRDTVTYPSQQAIFLIPLLPRACTKTLRSPGGSGGDTNVPVADRRSWVRIPARYTTTYFFLHPLREKRVRAHIAKSKSDKSQPARSEGGAGGY